MRMRTFLIASATAVACATALAAPLATSTGEPTTYDFRRPLLNGMGADSLADFAGKPVLVEFWGTR